MTSLRLLERPFLRITGGEARGRKINSPDGLPVRPTGAKVRQAFFNILGTKINGCRFLDLFAGSGLMGLEALSRGAQSLTFVDENYRVIKAIKSNLEILKYEADVICGDISKVVPKLKARSFDVIFADPPYASQLGETALRLVEQYDLLDHDGVLIIEHAKYLSFKTEPVELCCKEIRSYGQTVLSIYRHKDPPS